VSGQSRLQGMTVVAWVTAGKYTISVCNQPSVSSAFYLSGVGKLITRLWAEVKAGCIHLCLVTGYWLTTLQWIKRFLCNRKQRVEINYSYSSLPPTGFETGAMDILHSIWVDYYGNYSAIPLSTTHFKPLLNTKFSKTPDFCLFLTIL